MLSPPVPETATPRTLQDQFLFRRSDADADPRVHNILQNLRFKSKCLDLQIILQHFLDVLPIGTNGEDELVRLNLEATAEMGVGETILMAIERGGATGRTRELKRRDVSLGRRPLLCTRSFHWCGDFVQRPRVTLHAVGVKRARCIANTWLGPLDCAEFVHMVTGLTPNERVDSIPSRRPRHLTKKVIASLDAHHEASFPALHCDKHGLWSSIPSPLPPFTVRWRPHWKSRASVPVPAM
mmetsp:Transcript_63626/g.168539  ORF Transcript_63626/g.168539 Transcript_63626/m.168539 type:complete len:239 (-) Transcript_63626:383-1099(-)